MKMLASLTLMNWARDVFALMLKTFLPRAMMAPFGGSSACCLLSWLMVSTTLLCFLMISRGTPLMHAVRSTKSVLISTIVGVCVTCRALSIKPSRLRKAFTFLLLQSRSVVFFSGRRFLEFIFFGYRFLDRTVRYWFLRLWVAILGRAFGLIDYQSAGVYLALSYRLRFSLALSYRLRFRCC